MPMGANFVDLIKDKQGARVAGDMARDHHEGLDRSPIVRARRYPTRRGDSQEGGVECLPGYRGQRRFPDPGPANYKGGKSRLDPSQAGWRHSPRKYACPRATISSRAGTWCANTFTQAPILRRPAGGETGDRWRWLFRYGNSLGGINRLPKGVELIRRESVLDFNDPDALFLSG